MNNWLNCAKTLFSFTNVPIGRKSDKSVKAAGRTGLYAEKGQRLSHILG
jgi:hypothetical protein